MVTPIEIGRIVGSNDQSDYLVQINTQGEVPAPPSPHDRAFGQFVAIPVDGEGHLIGVIYTTQLLNPSYGTLGPRLSTDQELPIFSPDYLAETATVVGVFALGTARAHPGALAYDQSTPRTAATIDASVRRLEDREFEEFHRPDGRLRLAYFPRLLARPFPSLPDLLCAILDRLITAFPEDHSRLEVARQNIRWRAAVEVR